ncbi:2Fe-2S iron-sulfur cluster-binding protein [Bifidobacterium sp. ESL0763]|uniref:succinate dehydrogenase/fumarate reductase iron-sulfur subunit n=1 Tax=Bifidobacterium sp. ESL0763 TaxID=2983227 RepID=UPI0023F6FAA8|nr:2Fe-2S iron-sulfur cluster-binding protein [Bifidobacterium sp. ESL0763]MDF7664038.1 2Fe-2S iron-sulfur cluster-binding protein [Bifidobacterium sp. ESL0763]
MGDLGGGATAVTIRVHRFTARPERAGRRSSSPFASKASRASSSPFASRRSSSPFGDSPSAPKPRRRTRGKRWTQDYTIAVHGGETVLDCLLSIKRTLDPTLAFRYSCGHGICGSDAVAINGTPTLLCTAKVTQYAKPERSAHGAASSADERFRRTGSPSDGDADTDTNINTDNASNETAGDTSATPQAAPHTNHPSHLGVIELAPLPGFPVLRDLIADIDQMMAQIKRLAPYLKADGKLARTADGKIDMFEYLQSPEQLKRYELLSNCISCGVCEGSCPVYAGGEAFVGPAALIAQARFINDSRDQAADERLKAIATQDGITACQSVRACSRQCPRGIDVGEEMWQLTTKVNGD